MMGDRMLSTPSHTGENSSYSLQFRAPQFQCNTSTYRENLNMTTDDRIHPKSTGPAFISTWLSDGSIFSVKKYVMDHVYASQRNGSKRTGVVDVEHFQCRGVSVLFDLRVTHPNGIQEIERNISDLQPLKHFPYKIATGVSMPPLPYTNTSHYGEDVRNLTQSVAKLVPAMNERALLDAFGYLVESRSNQTCFGRNQNSSLATGDGCLKPSTLDNGTSIFICDWSCTSEVEARGTSNVSLNFLCSSFRVQFPFHSVALPLTPAASITPNSYIPTTQPPPCSPSILLKTSILPRIS
jgi:hypothetical protein